LFALDQHRCFIGYPSVAQLVDLSQGNIKSLNIFDAHAVLPEMSGKSIDLFAYDSSSSKMVATLWPFYVLVYDVTNSGAKLSATINWGRGGGGLKLLEQVQGAAFHKGILALNVWHQQQSGTSQSVMFYDLNGSSMSLKGSVGEFMMKGQHPRTAKLITAATSHHLALQKTQQVGQENDDYVLQKWNGMFFLGDLLCIGAGTRGIITFKIHQIQQIYQYQEVKKGTPATMVDVGGDCIHIVKVGHTTMCALVGATQEKKIVLLEESDGMLQVLHSYPLNMNGNPTGFANTCF